MPARRPNVNAASRRLRQLPRGFQRREFRDGGRTRLKQERSFNLLLTTVREAEGVGVLSDTR
jgi:hypothetical protein